MITTVTLNPCIDRTIKVENLTIGGHNRTNFSRVDLGGKGINVSIVVKQMGHATCALTFNHTESGTYLCDKLEDLGIEGSLVPTFGRLRENVKLYVLSTDEMTEINEEGTPVDKSTLSRFLHRLDRLLERTKVLIISGSIPPGLPDTLYYDMILQAKKQNIFTILDAQGVPLREGVKACPNLIKPNLYEMETLCGKKLENHEEILAQMDNVIAQGVGAICLSMGSEGAILKNGKGTWYTKGGEIDVKAVQGAGDSLVAGLAIGYSLGENEEGMLKMGVAMAQGSLLREGTLLCTRKLFDELYPTIQVVKLK